MRPPQTGVFGGVQQMRQPQTGFFLGGWRDQTGPVSRTGFGDRCPTSKKKLGDPNFFSHLGLSEWTTLIVYKWLLKLIHSFIRRAREKGMAKTQVLRDLKVTHST
jgi:hypothetical protein